MFSAVVATTALLAAAGAAAAQEAGTGGLRFGPNAERWEVRLGGAVYDLGLFTPQIFSGGVLNGEVLAPSPEILGWLGSPRPYIGADIALSDHPIHIFYAGLNWETYLTDRFYVGFSGGGSVNTDDFERRSPTRAKALGSHLLFHLQASAGFDVTDSLTAQVYFNHFSNAMLADDNDGIESVGARLGFRF